MMQNLVGIIRNEEELSSAIKEVDALRHRIANVSVEGHRQYNPGWNLAIDLRNMLLVSEAVAKAAFERKESRGGHTRDDFPMTDYDYWGKRNVVCQVALRRRRHRPGTTASRTPAPNWPNCWRKRH